MFVVTSLPTLREILISQVEKIAAKGMLKMNLLREGLATRCFKRIDCIWQQKYVISLPMLLFDLNRILNTNKFSF